MEIYFSFFISFCFLIFSVLKGVFIGYALVACWFIFVIISIKKGYTLREIGAMSYNGGRQSFVVIRILVLIGAVIGVWMASGTIPTIVYYCLKFVTPSKFIISSFVICCGTSFLIGTSLGTVSVVGIPLMIMARSGNINLNVVAGAIIAGAYFGDRCSPMSGSAALVASLTKTNIFNNINNMVYSSIIPFLLSLIFYYTLSILQPLKDMNNGLSAELLGTFRIEFIILLPAIIILILSLCKVKMYISIFISIFSAFVLAMFFQNHQLKDVVHYIILGFQTSGNSYLQNIIKGGGIVSMLKPSLVVFVSCSLSGIFEGISVFDRFKNILMSMELTRDKLFSITSIVSIVTAAFGCNQIISCVMTSEIMKNCYEDDDKYQFALDLENSGILISALIPWNIVTLVATTTMNVSTVGYIGYAFYLYIVPITYFIYSKYFNRIFNVNTNIQSLS